MPTGTPSSVKPAGMLIAGSPVLGLSWQFSPPRCGSPIGAAFRRSVGYASASSFCSRITRVTVVDKVVRFARAWTTSGVSGEVRASRRLKFASSAAE